MQNPRGPQRQPAEQSAFAVQGSAQVPLLRRTSPASQPQTLAVPPPPQVCVTVQVPQSSVPPHPSATEPQLSPAGHVVIGVQATHFSFSQTPEQQLLSVSQPRPLRWHLEAAAALDVNPGNSDAPTKTNTSSSNRFTVLSLSRNARREIAMSAV